MVPKIQDKGVLKEQPIGLVSKLITKREIQMKKRMIFWLGFSVIFCFGSWGHATVINFDDLEDGITGDFWKIPSHYGNDGLIWDNMLYTNGTDAPDKSGYYNGMKSERYVALNGPDLTDPDGDPWGALKTEDGGLFNFTGAFFSAGWNNGLVVTVEGYLIESGRFTLIASESFEVGVDYLKTDGTYDTSQFFEPVWYDGFEVDFNNINYLKFSSSGGNPAYKDIGEGAQFVMDDFHYTKSEPIPEPATLLLLGTGLVALAGIGRKRSRNHDCS